MYENVQHIFKTKEKKMRVAMSNKWTSVTFRRRDEKPHLRHKRKNIRHSFLPIYTCIAWNISKQKTLLIKLSQTASSKAIIIRKVQVRSVWDSLVKSVNKLCFEYRPHILNFFQGCRQVVFLFQSASTAAVIQDNFLKRAAERKIPRVGKKN